MGICVSVAVYVSVCLSVCVSVCGQIDDEDKYVYIGTTSGDVIIINVAMQQLRGVLPPVKKRFNKGVKAIGQFKSGEFVVGAGDGVVCLCDPQFNRTAYVPGRIATADGGTVGQLPFTMLVSLPLGLAFAF